MDDKIRGYFVMYIICLLRAWVNEALLQKGAPNPFTFISCLVVFLLLDVSEPKVVFFPLKMYTLI